MVIRCFNDKREMAKAAAEQAAAILRETIEANGTARMIAATGASQFEFLDALTSLPGMDWRQVEMFHLDEYIGLSATHPASFRRFLQERLIQRAGITNYFLLDGEQDAEDVIRRASKALRSAPIDVAFVGIGENGHLAFNDPPADFETDESYIVAELDEACRRQHILPAEAGCEVNEFRKRAQVVGQIPFATLRHRPVQLRDPDLKRNDRLRFGCRVRICRQRQHAFDVRPVFGTQLRVHGVILEIIVAVG